MSVAPGTQIGPYEIVAPLGAGRMGEVYRARDTRLKREVAVKVLPQKFARDTDRCARFRREAELLATLNHPHVAALYGLEEAGDLTALVLELVEGPTLADRLTEGTVPLDGRCRSRVRSPRRSKPRMRRASSTGISKRRTSKCGPMAP
jgi:eukaryotic-like serine/threonine-protein kinase